METSNLKTDKWMYELPIGSRFQFKNDTKIYKLIGYNSDKSKVMYISNEDKTIFENMKNSNTTNIDNLVVDDNEHCGYWLLKPNETTREVTQNNSLFSGLISKMRGLFF